MSESFKKFHEITKNLPPRTRTVEAFNLLASTQDSRGLSALDFGCGAGRDTKFLLDQGMTVTAVDADISAIEGVALAGDLSLVQARFDEFPFGEYDLVTSQLSLSFNPPETFGEMFQRLLDSIRPGGVLTCDIFGPNDGWSSNPAYTILNEQQIRALLEGIDIISLDEIEEDSFDSANNPKHWHTFRVLAQKPSK